MLSVSCCLQGTSVRDKESQNSKVFLHTDRLKAPGNNCLHPRCCTWRPRSRTGRIGAGQTRTAVFPAVNLDKAPNVN